MSQSSVIIAFLIVGFFLYVTVKGELNTYGAIIGV